MASSASASVASPVSASSSTSATATVSTVTVPATTAISDTTTSGVGAVKGGGDRVVDHGRGTPCSAARRGSGP
ncbi:hypothetical protein CC85DRAFT_283705 [Cutaneotrichosporon oleaginosum]|uniref:Uncharacterized protein n=1 Tax=Cutaneotrichosporon oleaginosum TaxID=879819 RepID=A0A0J1B8R7_9TREE|nr:uncharacterized protein CC85DRAFT_283705 [Cutaneotrichosporon oleaginosum]KLT44184.1 hypothetical protein CC85DRAFT_283705 [Cutaneotrichosporon oleaginosum]TXT11647.1 hypothetical protein COLE_02057 [Cutaneotrichosporon oleaginosum]